jgi:glycosyltransferase involved in cell wall biosynthesis
MIAILQKGKARMTKIDASVFIITLNEERHIGRALRSVADFTHVVVVDSGSTDKTLRIAKSFTPHVVHHDFENFAAQKNYALSLCEKDYCLTLDADEEVTPELAAELRCFMVAPNADGLVIPRMEMVFGRRQHPWSHTQKQIRFMRKGAARFAPKLVHESIAVDGIVHQAKAGIVHYGDGTIGQKLKKIDSYSRLRAAEKYAAGRRPSLIKLVLVGPLTFLKTWLVKRYILNGRGGFVISVMNGHYAFLKEARLFEAYAQGDED